MKTFFAAAKKLLSLRPSLVASQPCHSTSSMSVMSFPKLMRVPDARLDRLHVIFAAISVQNTSVSFNNRSIPYLMVMSSDSNIVVSCLETLLKRKQSRELFAICIEDRKRICQLAGATLLLRSKGETADEVTGLLDVLFEHSDLLFTPENPAPPGCIDIVGTGGDGAHTVNISSSACVVAAACGVFVIKHGGGSTTSRCGSKEFFESLRVHTAVSPATARECLDAVGVTFCLASAFNSKLASCKEVRQGLGVPTIFNVIGPVLNPGQPHHRLLGVFSPILVPVVMQVLKSNGCSTSFVFYGAGGLDEISPIGVTEGLLLKADGSVEHLTIDPHQLGLPPCHVSDLKGGSPAENAKLVDDLFTSKDTNSHISHTICLNAAVALWLTGRVESIADGLKGAWALAEGKAESGVSVDVFFASEAFAAVKEGRAKEKLEEWRRASLRVLEN